MKALDITRLTLDEKIGQLFVVAGRGTFMGESSLAYRELLRHVEENHVGGVIWFLSNVYETAFLNERLQAAARVPLLISADLEAGIGMRFTDTTFWPSAMAVAAAGDLSLAEEQGRITARESRAIGINHIYAPVADVNVSPKNPVINTRSFGEDPHEVAKFVAAVIRGIQSERCLATAKHFPGHGDTHVDSHRALPVLDVDRARLDAVELVPFRAAIEAGVGSVMIGHLAIPSLDPEEVPVRRFGDSTRENVYGTEEHEITKRGTIPATISKPIIDGLLRRELGFDGLVVTDSFEMGGLVAHFDPGEAAVRAIEAGEDQIVYSADPDAAIQGVRRAVESGRLSEARIDESVRRILQAKGRVHHGVAPAAEIFREVDSAMHRGVAETIAQRAITLLRDRGGLLPLRAKRIAVVVATDLPESDLPIAEGLRELRTRVPSTRVYTFDSRSRVEDGVEVDGDAIVMLLALRPRSGAGRIAVPEVVRAIVERAGGKTVAVLLGSPYVTTALPRASTILCAYGIQPVAQVAAVRAIFGEAEIRGRCPVTIGD